MNLHQLYNPTFAIYIVTNYNPYQVFVWIHYILTTHATKREVTLSYSLKKNEDENLKIP